MSFILTRITIMIMITTISNSNIASIPKTLKTTTKKVMKTIRLTPNRIRIQKKSNRLKAIH